MIEPSIAEGPVPERFSRELPASVADYDATWPDYPASHVSRGLCAGDPDVVGRLERAAGAALAAGDEPAALREIYGHLLEWCGRPELCEWATAAVEEQTGAAAVAWVALTDCPGDAVQSLFEQGGAPASPLIEYWTARSWHKEYKPRLDPHIVAALQEVARAGSEWQTRSAAVLVSEVGAPAAEILLSLYDELPAGQVRDQVASSFSELEHPRAKELFAEYCSRSKETDAVCQPDWSPLEGLPEPEPEPESAEEPLTCIDPDLRYLLTGGDADAGWDTLQCLAELSAIDRAAAVEEARTLKSWDLGNTELGNFVLWIDAFPEAGQLEGELRQLGLLPRGPLPGTDNFQGDYDLTPGAVLARVGPVHCFDLETGQFPNRHDRLLYDLAELAGPPLDAAVFEEEAPPFEFADGGWWVAGRQVDEPPPGVTEGMPYRLRAYLDGRIYDTEAQDFGDWFDLDRSLGLLNAMAVDRDSPARLVAMPVNGQDTCVLAAPREAVLAGIEAGLLEVSRGGDTERALGIESEMLRKFLEDGGE